MMLAINDYNSFAGPQRILTQESSAFLTFQQQVGMLDSIPPNTQLTKFEWQLLGMQVRYDAHTRWIQSLNEGEL